jgi:hypothetical protein
MAIVGLEGLHKFKRNVMTSFKPAAFQLAA